MKERPILFSAPMVRALLDGSKTQTRRIAKPVKHPDFGNIYSPGALVLEREPQHVIDRSCPYGQPGDRLWVKETWRTDASLDDKAPSTFNGWPVRYDADGLALRHGAFYGDTKGKTRPSLFMPRWASRITLEIVGVRVERLQDISKSDALAEGVNVHPDHHGKPDTSIYSPAQAYRDLWESINGVDSWDLNPWVWVVKFRRLMKVTVEPAKELP